ncbi:helix-turn-helix domain-containing protein [Actinomycetospora aeridis]|uniref:Helix-turn-helix domain-containing protein n=1 Tax=Actinomycetospora aeridis TaxID=3129231 RepID=A0ABU8N861_9PSEU
MTAARHSRGVGGGRSLKTAAEALAALRFLGAAEDGVTAEALATELGKSAATARYLLNTLCQEGFALRDRRTGTFRLQENPPWGDAWGDAEAPHALGPSELPELTTAPIAFLERARVRRRAHAADREAYVRDCSCHGAPTAPDGQVAAGTAISPSARHGAAHAEELTGVLHDVAATAPRGWRVSASDLPPPLPADPVPPGH